MGLNRIYLVLEEGKPTNSIRIHKRKEIESLGSYLWVKQSVCVPYIVLISVQAIVRSMWKMQVHVRRRRLHECCQDETTHQNDPRVLFHWKREETIGNLRANSTKTFRGKVENCLCFNYFKSKINIQNFILLRSGAKLNLTAGLNWKLYRK